MEAPSNRGSSAIELRLRRSSAGCTRSPVGTRPRPRRMRQCIRPERRDDDSLCAGDECSATRGSERPARGRRPGSCRARGSSSLISTLMSMPSQARDRWRGRATQLGSSSSQLVDPLAGRELGVVMDHDLAVRGQAHVELDPVGAHRASGGERLECVLSHGPTHLGGQ